MHRLVFLILLVLVACNDPVGTDEHVDRAQVQQREADDVQKDPYATTAARVEGDDLVVDVGYSGGCRTHEFTLVSQPSPIMSPLPAVELTLIHDANEDLCEAYLREELRFDLTPLRQDGANQILLFLMVYGAESPWTPTLRYNY
jgi:hypothetical protein